MVVSPDVGGVVRARAFAKKLSDAPLAIVDKRRQGHNLSEVTIDFFQLYALYFQLYLIYIYQLEMCGLACLKFVEHSDEHVS